MSTSKPKIIKLTVVYPGNSKRIKFTRTVRLPPESMSKKSDGNGNSCDKKDEVNKKTTGNVNINLNKGYKYVGTTTANKLEKEKSLPNKLPSVLRRRLSQVSVKNTLVQHQKPTPSSASVIKARLASVIKTRRDYSFLFDGIEAN